MSSSSDESGEQGWPRCPRSPTHQSPSSRRSRSRSPVSAARRRRGAGLFVQVNNDTTPTHSSGRGEEVAAQQGAEQQEQGQEQQGLQQAQEASELFCSHTWLREGGPASLQDGSGQRYGTPPITDLLYETTCDELVRVKDERDMLMSEVEVLRNQLKNRDNTLAMLSG